MKIQPTLKTLAAPRWTAEQIAAQGITPPKGFEIYGEGSLPFYTTDRAEMQNIASLRHGSEGAGWQIGKNGLYGQAIHALRVGSEIHAACFAP
jgi:hypothetical protein